MGILLRGNARFRPIFTASRKSLRETAMAQDKRLFLRKHERSVIYDREVRAARNNAYRDVTRDKASHKNRQCHNTPAICLLNCLIFTASSRVTPLSMRCLGYPQGQTGCTPRAPTTRRPCLRQGCNPPCRFYRGRMLSPHSLKALKGFD